MSAMHGRRLLDSRVLATNTVWSVFGLVAPALVGLVAVPPIVRGLGIERFGVLTLAWMLIGYFGIFDFGIGRAVTKQVAERLVSHDEESLGGVLWTGWYMMLALGILGAVVAAAAVPLVLRWAVHVSPALQDETRTSFYLLAASVPVVVFSTGVRGALEAAQRFAIVNAVRVPTGLLSFVVPLVALRYTPDLRVTVAGLIAARTLGLLVSVAACVKVFTAARRPVPVDRAAARELLSFGAWMTVSNAVSPLMVSFDRFFVSAMISVAAVTYYATPYEVVSKVMFIPGAIAAVLFPAFSAARVSAPDRMATLFQTALRVVFVVELPVVFVVVCFAPELLRAWIGPEFAVRSAGVMRWLMVGVLVNSLGQIAFSLLQGYGRSDLTGKIHLAEAPVYVVLLVVCIRQFGILGAAYAWFVRTAVDTALLFWFVRREAGNRVLALFPAPAAPVALLAFVLAASALPSLTARILAGVGFAIAEAFLTWQWGLTGAQRTQALLLAQAGLGPLRRSRP